MDKGWEREMHNNLFEFSNATKMTEDIYTEITRKLMWEESKRRIILILAMVALICCIAIWLTLSGGIKASSIVSAIIIAASLPITILIYVDAFTFRVRRIYRKQTKNAQARIYNYTFEDEYITAVWQTGTSSVFYHQISVIYETKNAYILIADQNQKIRESFVIDKNGFSSSSCDEFLRVLRERVTIQI